MTRCFALATKTFKNDLADFAKLCETIDRHMPDVRHYVLIDRVDLPLFARFASPKRIIVDCDEALPELHQFQLLNRRLWWRFPAKIVRGWIYQQLAKISFVAGCTEDAIVLVDSDTKFIAPVQDRHVFDRDRVVLFRNPGKPSGGAGQSDRWHNFALKVLGQPENGYTGADYISQAVIWSPDVVRAMIGRIEQVTGKRWYDALIGRFRFSEYVVYGVFCEQLAGPHKNLVSPREEEICHCSWYYDLSSDGGVDAFVAGLADHHVAILLQSNLGMTEAQRQQIFARLAAHDAGANQA